MVQALKPSAFTVPVLGTLWHSRETEKILEPHTEGRQKSKYVRDAIMKFATNKGFQYSNDDNVEDVRKPLYLTIDIWIQIKTLQRKSYNVNYIFLVAWFWLQQLSEFDGYNKSKLIREIIEDANGHL